MKRSVRGDVVEEVFVVSLKIVAGGRANASGVAALQLSLQRDEMLEQIGARAGVGK